MVWIPVISQITLGAFAFLPFLQHQISISRWLKKPLKYPKESPKDELMILLPVWNEGKIIVNKLDNLASHQEIKTSLLIIDSASDDNTVEITKSWIDDNESKFHSVNLIVMEERLGKTPAVCRALNYLSEQNFEGLVLMTDADATIAEGSVERMYGWFSNSNIGAVGAKAVRKQSTGSERPYRDMFETIRLGESNFDSTPFLEGSCMMWRFSALDISQLDKLSNADDAQIATAVRLSGLKSIFDNKASFSDIAPPTIDGQRRQKIRRAQGLQRLLRRQKSNSRLKLIPRFKKIFRRQNYLHNVSPVLAFSAGLSAIARWVIVGINGIPTGNEAIIHASLGAIELFCLTAWLSTRQGIVLPLLSKVGSILTGLEYLFIAKINSLRGIPSHIWDQHSDTRELISKEN
mgnify:FL=1|tara:strand:- start:147 stop:1361 length:1215 start_codon:yes stop_codon:yes gene_type:complete